MGAALTNTMSVIAFADGLMLYYLHHHKPEDNIKDLVKEVRATSSECFSHWERFLNQKEFLQIYNKMKVLEDKLLQNKTMSCYTSFVIDMVETLRSYISDQERRGSLTRLLNSLKCFHDAVDDNNIEAYEQGAIASSYWQEVLAKA